MLESIYNVDVLNLLSFLTKCYLTFYFVLSALKEDASVLRLFISSLIVALYYEFKVKLENATLLLELIILTIAILVVRRDYTFGEFLKAIAIYGLITILAKSLENFAVALIAPNQALLSLIVCCSILLSILVVKMLTKLYDSPKSRKLVYSVMLVNGLIALKTRAFWDSGNQLYFKGRPVIMISSKVAKKLKLKNTFKIPISTVGGRACLDGGDIGVKIFSDKKSHKLLEVRYCISDTIVSRGYEVLLHKDMEVV